MINIDINRERHLYRMRIAAKETTAYYFDIPQSPFVYQFHNDGKNLFGSIADKCGNMLQYVPKWDLN